jgi:hypothetical protein
MWDGRNLSALSSTFQSRCRAVNSAQALTIPYSATVVVNPHDFEVLDTRLRPDMTTK